MDDNLSLDADYLPDVTDRWIGRIDHVDDTTLVISVTPREDRGAKPESREFARTLFRGRRTPRVGMNVAISEFTDGDTIIDPITHWWSRPFFDIADITLMAGMFIVAIFS